MRDDAVLGRALPLDRGLGPVELGDRCVASSVAKVELGDRRVASSVANVELGDRRVASSVANVEHHQSPTWS